MTSPESLLGYTGTLGRLAGLVTERDDALRRAESAGRADLDEALCRQRGGTEAAGQLQRRLEQASDALRSLEARHGIVEAAPPDSLPPGDPALLSRALDGVLRDLESATHAQSWVERRAADLSRLPAQPPTPVPPSLAPPSPGQAPVPAVPARREPAGPATRPRPPWLPVAISIAVVLVALLVFVLTRR